MENVFQRDDKFDFIPLIPQSILHGERGGLYFPSIMEMDWKIV